MRTAYTNVLHKDAKYLTSDEERVICEANRLQAKLQY